MKGWLERIFPALRNREFPTQVTLELPSWDEQDAERLELFLESQTGKKVMDTFRHSVTGMALSTEDLTEKERAERRALAYVLEGLVSMSDIEYWRFNARK